MSSGASYSAIGLGAAGLLKKENSDSVYVAVALGVGVG